MHRRRLASRLALVVALLLIGVLLLEGVARFLAETDDAFRELCLDGDDYWISRWLAQRDAGTLPADAHPVHRRDPQLGWVPHANLRQRGLTTNEHGLRGAADVPFEKRPGERRIVVLGDSFTFGEGVHDHEVWTALLAKQLAAESADVTVLNLGVMGYGLDQACLRMEELGTRFGPDLVLLGLFGPDLDRNELSFRDDAKPRFVLDGVGLAVTNVPVPHAAALHARLQPPRVASYSWAMVRKGMNEWRRSLPSAQKWELARRLLDRLQRVTARSGAGLAIAWFPAKRGSFARTPELAETIVVDWAADRGVPLVNVRDAFVALGASRYGDVWNNHWTPFGNEVVAEAVEQGLLHRQLLPLR